MAAKSYFKSLAEFALKAYLPPSPKMRDHLGELISQWGGKVPAAEDESPSALRDHWQEVLTQVLVLRREGAQGYDPRRDGQTQTVELQIRDVADRATRIERVAETAREGGLGDWGWAEQAARLREKYELNKAVRGAVSWVDFLHNDTSHTSPAGVASVTEARSYRSEQQLNFWSDAASLVDVYAALMARRIAESLTSRKRVQEVFSKYGFVSETDGKSTAERLASQLAGNSPVAPADRDKFKNWPAAAVCGAFASDLANVLDHVPSAWVLERELTCISDRRTMQGQDTIPDGDLPRDRAWKAGLVGLAFSGGGIRSATFNLGILQGLAKLGSLPVFDYLSTVSGGGYISSWLINWIRREGMDEVTHRLSPASNTSPSDSRLAPIRFLRDFSNYLTPSLGLLSADLWVIGVVWFRNTFLNLLVLLPTLLAVLFLPRFLELWAETLLQHGVSGGCGYLATLALCVLCAATFTALNLRQFPAGPGDVALPPVSDRQKFYSRPWYVLALIVFPIFVAAWIASLKLWCLPEHGTWEKWVFGSAVLVALFVLRIAKYLRCFELVRGRTRKTSAPGMASMAVISVALGAVAVFITMGIRQVFSMWTTVPISPSTDAFGPVAVFGVPLVVFALFLLLILMVGFMGRNLPDGASKWLVRLRAYIAIYSVIWLMWVGISVYGPRLDGMLWNRGWAKWPVMGTWVWTTLRGVLAGKDPRTSGGKADWKTSVGFYATVGPYVFIFGLLLLLSLGAQSSLESMERFLGGSLQLRFWALCLSTALSGSLGWMMAWCIDINEFSLNTFYRGRLVRAYLGAANKNRYPNPFTGFDPADDVLPLTAFKAHESDPEPEGRGTPPIVSTGKRAGPYDGPFPIYNATMNLVHGDELAWQERKGASFIFTPEVCGYETPWNAAANPQAFRKLQYLAYRDTDTYAYSDPGMHLGTAMSISGAAVSPNMGSYSQAATSFLLTVFNARLGWWLGNPRHRTTWDKAGPTQGLIYLAKELLGLTNDRSGFIYISDGGHFENLAIYELVRRRCRFIVACDAEEDSGFGFNGLGNAIRKCREDFGVEIDLRVDMIKPEPATMLSRSHCVVGTIRYPDQAGFGYLLYIKASLVGDEPEDVLQYRVKCPAFPHQSTSDQWFTESQFESYRRLGQHIAETTFQRAVGDLKNKTCRNDYTQQLFEQLRDNWYPPSKAIQKNFTRHAQALDALVHEMRSDEVLLKLDVLIIPAQGGAQLAIEDVDKPKVFLFLSSVIQLMENIYLDLDLEMNADHPHNAGWIQIFRAWAQSQLFREAWRRYGWACGRSFRRFCSRNIGLPEA
jgi:hypothetical protein